MPSSRVSFAGSPAGHQFTDPLANIDEATVSKGRDLLRTIPAFPPPAIEDGGEGVLREASISEAGPGLWQYPEPKDEADTPEPPPDPKAKAAAKGAAKAAAKPAGKGSKDDLPPEEPVGPLEAKADPQGGALLLSHAWDAPGNWSTHFVAQSFADAKSLQVSTALACLNERTKARHESDQHQSEIVLTPSVDPRVWVDCASLPDPVDAKDHPCEQLSYGPFRMPVGELKRLFPPLGQGVQERYTVLRVPEGDKWEGTMQIRKFDEKGRPGKNTTPEEVAWDILPGWYHVLSAKVIPEDRLSPDMAAEYDEFRPREEHLRNWLRDKIWVEITLGTLRAECFLAVHAMLGLHGGMIAVMAWNYFDRLWPLCEWAVFCLRHGVTRVQLAADAFAPARVEFHRAVRRLSVQGALCRDQRDRPLLLELLELEFSLQAREEKQGFSKPAGTLGLVPIVERIVDFSPVERFVRATTIGLFAREAVLAASRQRHGDDEAAWCELADDLGLDDLHKALKACKPWDWYEAAKEDASSLGPPATSEMEEELDEETLAKRAAIERIKAEEAGYAQRVDDWWAVTVLPVLENERQLASRGGRAG